MAPPRPPRPFARRTPERVHELQRQVDVLTQERDRATARANRLEERLDGSLRPDLEHLFVITYGRSGSTLLQGILNSIPGYLIRGENAQAVRHLHAFHRAANAQRRKHVVVRRRRGLGSTPTEPTNPWYGIDGFRRGASVAGIRRLTHETLIRPEPDTRVAGFKEIRWHHDDVEEYVAFLQRVFPGARFVVNTRDLDAVSRSKWWGDRPGSRERLEQVESRLLALGEALGDAAFHVRYDDYVADPRALQPLFEWLGEDFDETRVRAVMDRPHSY